MPVGYNVTTSSITTAGANHLKPAQKPGASASGGLVLDILMVDVIAIELSILEQWLTLRHKFRTDVMINPMN
jgi:hypothetical protein